DGQDSGSSENVLESKIGDMDPDNIITAVPPNLNPNDPAAEAAEAAPQTNSFSAERGWEPPSTVTNANSAATTATTTNTTRDGAPPMDNMIVRPGGGGSESSDMDSLETEMEDFLNQESNELEGTAAGGYNSTQPPTDLDSIEAEMEDFIEESEKEWNNGAATAGGYNETQPPTDLDSIEAEMEDFIEESEKEWNAVGNETVIESGDADSDEESNKDEDEVGDEDGSDDEDSDGDNDEGSDEDGDESEDEDADSDAHDEDGDESDEDENATTQIGEATPVPTDLASIEAEMAGFIEKSNEEWHSGKGTNATVGNSTAIGNGDEDADADLDADLDADESSSANGDGGIDSAKDETLGSEGSETNNPIAPGGKKDDDETTPALFGSPTLAPSAKIVWNDPVPVFKPELPASAEECTLSSTISVQACMKNTYVLGGVGSILILLLLCICRKCCCRSSRRDERGQYRQVADQYGDMKYDNTFSDDYSAGSAGDIELSLAEMNG
ncbi:MAG: hypothetical protein SGBAC_008672, partial [Bacillariaceae sp.]